MDARLRDARWPCPTDSMRDRERVIASRVDSPKGEPRPTSEDAGRGLRSTGMQPVRALARDHRLRRNGPSEGGRTKKDNRVELGSRENRVPRRIVKRDEMGRSDVRIARS